MKNIVMQTLQGLYIPEENIFKESFIAEIASQQEIKENNAIDNDIEAREVRIIHMDKEHSFAVVSNTTILQAALDDGIDLPYSCRGAFCGTCRGKAISGKIKMDENYALAE